VAFLWDAQATRMVVSQRLTWETPTEYVSYLRAADEFLKANDFIGAERRCKEALELNPANAKVQG